MMGPNVYKRNLFCSPRLHLIKNTVKDKKTYCYIVKHYYNLKLWNVIYLYGGKNTFSASLLQSSVLHDPSEITLLNINVLLLVENLKMSDV